MKSIRLALFTAFVCALPACGSGDHAEVSQTSFGIGHGGDGGRQQEKPADAICEPGGQYVCECESGNLGNEFCAWDGLGFTACELCGQAGTVLEDLGIYCNIHPDEGMGEVFTPCEPSANLCAPIECRNNSCVVLSAIPLYEVADTAQDCKRTVCDGFGNAVSIPDPDDCSGACDVHGACVP